ncbi:peptidoglycan/LPS O-acetylase OafA/YrhL [Microbacterium trichothecenolyticum]|uniref:acyltransferase family protein n=1 Tax=Microbacterium trichothecenolyticum TaxID=69370 RepID=UPI002863555F|nr:acyltransferase [Microbacterium trichothecenolyticum]MDR7112511.1 peptidoglycan/LPS O-acetylase OafA/YrhL [Microbacterium trichothecenolyticum]
MTFHLVGSPFPYRRNSLNLFRLILAALVLYAHAYYIAGVEGSPSFNGENLGGWAVMGFFVLSGFLITRSRVRTSAGTYLVHRIARIMPAFLVCLVAIAFVFGPLALLVQGRGLSGYLSTEVTPFEYVWGNIALYIRQYGIGTTLVDVPYPGVWNGSLWTLYFEFFCYMIVWAIGSLAIYRRSILLVAGVWAASVALRLVTGLGVTAGLDSDFLQLARLFPFFAAGSLIYFVTERWGLSRLLGIVSIPAAAVLMVFVPIVGGQLAAPLLAYALLYLSTIVPQPRWIARNDVSYGFYIYAWPVQQLAFLAGGMALGFAGYILTTMVVTFILGWLSWVVIERPAMALARPKGHVAGDIGSPQRAPSS